jgi:hypothetical protein
MLVLCELRYEINACVFLKKSSMPSVIMTTCSHDHRGNGTLTKEETRGFYIIILVKKNNINEYQS